MGKFRSHEFAACLLCVTAFLGDQLIFVDFATLSCMLSTLLRCSEVTARDGPSGVDFWPHSIIDKDKATDRLEKGKIAAFVG